MLSLPASRGVVPHVTSVAPIAVEVGRDFELAVTGSNIADEDATLLCRMDGADFLDPDYDVEFNSQHVHNVGLCP